MTLEKSTSTVDIPIKNLSKTSKMIINYFGIKTIHKLFSRKWKSVCENNRGCYRPPSLKKSVLESFLDDIGNTINYTVRDTIQKIIDRYWTLECEIEYRKYLSKYGFFSYKRFWIDIQEWENGCKCVKKLKKYIAYKGL